MKATEIPGKIDWLIFFIATALLLFSVPFVYSASAYVASQKFGSTEGIVMGQIFRVGISLGCIIFFARIDYHRYKHYSKLLYIVGIGALLLVLAVGVKTKGAARWIDLGGLSIQPSEYAKYALVIFMSTWLSDNFNKLHDFKKGLLPVLAAGGLVIGLIALQPNFSSAMVISIIMLCMLFVGNVKMQYFLTIFGIGISLLGVYGVSAAYRMKRIMSYIGLGDDGSSNYQLKQALIAFANGGLFGVGPGQSNQRDKFLPESYSDFISSIIGEEYGFFGILVMMTLFALFLFRGLRIARFAPDRFGSMLAFGITITISAYAFVNVGVNCGVLPTTGLPLPFLSYGGTAVFFSASAVGILLNIASQSGMFPKGGKV
ncbi:MAG: putative lipid II flippase FtsW [Ignavibacteria bacterium]|jgi:cell division protein FtsW|nr:cell cycle protein [Chlorobiota bacterium]